MRNAVVGIIIGIVVGVVVGATVVAPRLRPEGSQGFQAAQPVAEAPMPPAGRAGVPPDTPDGAPNGAPVGTPGGAPVGAPDGKKVAVAVAERDKTHPPFPEQVEAPKEMAAKPETVSGATPAAKPASEPAPQPGPQSGPQTAQGSATASAGSAAEAASEANAPAAPVAAAGGAVGATAPPAPAPEPRPAVIAKAEPLPPEPEPIRWRMGSAYASTLPQLGTLAKKLDRDIWRVSDGKLEIKFFEPGALVPPLEMFDAVRAGVIEAAFSSPGFWGNKVPALQLFAAVPFGPTAKEFLAWIYFGGGQELFEELYHAHGIHSVFCGLIAPEASGWFRKRIRTVEDLKGLRMRFFGLGAKVMERLGVVTSRLTDGDIFMAMESGEIDAAEFSMPAIDLKLGLYHMAKNYYFPGWHQPATFFELMINLEKWKQLPPTQKAQVEAVCGDNIRYGLAEGEAAQFQALKALQAEGVQIRRWPNEIMEALSAAWVDVARDEAKADRNFKRVWASLSAFRRDYAIWQELSRPY